jgi:neutral ceramidase
MMGLLLGRDRREITPPPGVPLIGYGNRFAPNITAKDPLYITTLYLTDGEAQLVLITADLLAVSDATVARVQASVEPHVVIACSHTHSGPLAHAAPTSLPHYRWYVHWLVTQMINSVQAAMTHTVPAQIARGQSTASIAINRRQRQPDGSVVIGHNPDGPVDDSVTVIQLQREDGRPLANLVNTACHPTSLGPSNVRASADWVGAMRHRVEQETGVLCAFVQGACADLNPYTQHDITTQWDTRTMLGESVAGSVRAALLDLQPVKPGPITATPLTIDIPLEAEPGVSYRKALAVFAGVPSALVDPVLRLLFPWDADLRETDGQPVVGLRADVVHIGGLTLFGIGAEVFTEVGMALQHAHPGAVIAGVTNGCIGYLPTPAEHDLGGYEVDIAPYFFRLPGRVNRDSADAVIAALLDSTATGA